MRQRSNGRCTTVLDDSAPGGLGGEITSLLWGEGEVVHKLWNNHVSIQMLVSYENVMH